MGASIGGSTAGVGPYDPSKGQNAEYFKQVQLDLNKRYSKSGANKKKSPAKEK